jgi:cytochrome c oxidase assembly protein subunit 11
MMVHPGQAYQATYTAKNLLNKDVVSQSIPSVAPSKAAEHFNKTECFCFTEQAFKAKEQRTMPLTFIIDPDVPEDVDTITLSYTLFTKSIKS